MRTSTFRLGFFTLLMCLGLSAFAQQNSYYNYNYPWTFGLNGGLAWQYSDVNGGAGYGFGMDLSKRIGGNPDSWFAFDLRGRLQLARQYGQGYERVYDLQNFDALDGTNGVDYTNLGYAFHNHETTMGELDFEGVITLNRLRERTGWVVQGFGGIGIGLYNTVIDQTDGMNFYDYSLIDTTQSNGAIRRDIRALRDRTYETQGSGGFQQNNVKAAIMPSLGFGVGYQFTPRFSLGLEHKATWVMADNLDAVIDPTSPQPNDVHHYTSLYLRWTLGEDKGNKPIIDITAPNRSPYTVQTATGSVRADIKNVSRRSDVSVNMNGQRVDYFDFNTATEEFFLTVPLVGGQNTITIYAQNDYGSDEGSVVFIYEVPINNGGNNGGEGNNGGNNGNNNGGNNNNPNPQPNENPAQVDIITPRNNPFSTDNNTVNIEATINNITNRNSIRYTVNGYGNTNFNYSGRRFTSTVTLQEGNNVIEISATNSRGEVRDARTIIYTKSTVQAPIITFTNPNRNPFEANTTSFNVKSNIQNVDNQRNISFLVNNQPVNFDFRNGVLSSGIMLQNGANVIKISANNEGGTDNASTTIVYKKEIAPPAIAPKVRITTPGANPFNTDNANIMVYAAIENISAKNEITFKVNGSTQAFNYNNGKFNADVNLVEGNNRLEVTVNNAGGNASDFVNIFYKKLTVIAPKVTVKMPTANPLVTFAQTEVITAVIIGINNQKDILFKLNGLPSTKFSYSEASNLFKVTVNLKQGDNTFEIIATNAGGTDKGEGRIIYKPQISAQPPVITVSNPSKTPYTSPSAFINLQATITNVVDRNDVTLTIGGKINNSFSYKNGALSIQFDLPNGATAVVITAVNGDGNDTESVVINYNPQPTVQKPVVNIVQPGKSPYTSNTSAFMVQAMIQNVTNKNDVTVKVGGKPVMNFTFEKGTLKYAATIPNGGVTIEISATNAGGSDTKSVVLNYNQPKQPPVITMINPTKSPAISTQPFIELKAKVQYVKSRNEVTLVVNGNRVSGFTFVKDILTYQMDIATNGSKVEITATNADGQDNETVLVTYSKPVLKPLVTIIDPRAASYNSKNPTYTVRANTENIATKNQVVVKVNGKTTGDFTFAANNVSIPATLVNGKTTVEITVSNADGSDTKSVVLSYNKPKQPPVITMISPAKSPSTTAKLFIDLKAKVQYVDGRNNITMTVNGNRVPGFGFSNNILAYQMDIPQSGATIIITATNADGQDTKTTVMNYNPPVSKPTITLKVPTSTNVTTTKATKPLSVIVGNVTAKNQIQITLNGKALETFNFNTNNGLVTASLSLRNGTNVLIVKATNTGGVATQNINYNRKVINATKPEGNKEVKPVGAKPIIVFLTPSKTNTEATTKVYIVKVKTTGITKKEDIVIKLNGKVIKGYDYNVKNGSVTFKVNLVTGNNTIIITAKNDEGSTTMKTVVKLGETTQKETGGN
jgi:hypothetical protein